MVSKYSDRGDYSKRSISDFGAFTTPSVPPHSVKGASCLGFGAAPNVGLKTNRDSGITH